MTALEMTVERLRPLVNTTAWEFCIIWALGDDPSRFILWKGCCCCGGGGRSQYSKVKEEKGKEQLFLPKCRDSGIQHPVRTEACRELAKFPLFIPLYSGIHGEVIMSKQPKWNLSTCSSTSDKKIGTQVLVPVAGGLVELCSSKHVPTDEKTIDFIRAECISAEQLSMAAHTFAGFIREPLCSPFYDPINIAPNGTMHELSFTSRPNLISKSGHHLGYEGSSTVSDPSSDNQRLHLGSASGHVSCDESQEKSSGRCPANISSSLNLKKKQCAFLDSDSANRAAHIDDSQARGRTERESGRSKNLLTERKRRKKIKDLQYALRALVPNITKMHTAAILGDAIDYINELQTSAQKYEEELREMAEDESPMYNAEEDDPNLPSEDKDNVDKLAQINDNQGHPSPDEKKEAKVEIDVHQIGAGEFLVRITCQKRKGAFLQLMQAMDVSELQIIDANVTTCNALVLNVLRVEAKRKIQPETLKEALIKYIQAEETKNTQSQNIISQIQNNHGEFVC